MSAILGVFGGGDRLDDRQVRAILRAMRARGTERVAIWRDEDVVLAVGRYEWELAPAFSGGTLIAADERYAVAADASLYCRRQLAVSFEDAGVRPRNDSAPELILAAFRAWGERCAHALDGDFAFVVWDRARRRAVAARDFGGKRPLHYATPGRDLVVASTIGGVVAHPRCPTALNPRVLAATAAGLVFSAGPETAYEAVRVLPNAHRFSWIQGTTPEPVRFWEPPVGGPPSRLSHDDAAEHLRDLLCVAARERMDPGAASTVWMSGGWDSTAVFAAAQHVAREDGLAHRPLPVSISYPQGDPGREDELIQSVADHWHSPVHWLDIAEIPFFDRERERAASRDEPYVHLYEKWNGALAAGTRACGSRIALDGNGGDQLFQNSDVFLADLFWHGRWRTLAREWPARRRGGFREFFSTVVQPNLGPGLLWAASVLRGGRPLRHYLERRMPAWLDPDFVAGEGLAEHDQGFLSRPLDASHAEREIDWYFTCLFVSRAFSKLAGVSLAAGVELRSPLSDRRVVEFALSRPWWERSSGAETKRLLRRSMRGLLPDPVLAPRPHRTGITSGYSHAWMRDVFPRLLAETLERPLLLEEMGIVRSDALRRATDEYVGWGGDSFVRVNLFYTLQTELWLRARSAGPGPVEVADASLSAIAC